MSFKHSKLTNYNNFDTLASQDARKFFYQYRRDVKKEKGKLIERKIFKKLIVDFHQLLFEEMCDGFEFRMFSRLGTFSIKKSRNEGLFTDKGGFKRHVNWKETVKIWKENPEKKGKAFIYHPYTEYSFMMTWSRRIAQFKNMHFYSTRFNNDLKMKLRHRILNNPNFDAYES